MYDETSLYQWRVKKEKEELDIKLKRLNEFLISPLIEDIDKAERLRLVKQAGIMNMYSDVLQERISNFK